MNVGPHTGGGGLLPPIHAVRHVTFTPPLTPPATGVMDAVEKELQRRGARVRRASPEVVEFEAPGLWGLFDLTFAPRRKAAVLVGGGTVRFDPASPERGLRLDLRLNPWLTYALPCLFVAAVLVQPVDVAMRLLVLVGGAVAAWINYGQAAGVYITWIGEAAAKAEPLPPPSARGGPP